jgi:hypothetical protein
MAERLARLSAMPSFVRQAQSLWNGVFNPRVLLDPKTPYRDLLMMAGSHRWELKTTSMMVAPTPDRVAVIDVALGLLERGTWTVPTWYVEQVLADRFKTILGWRLEERDAGDGSLGHELVCMPADEHVYQGVLVTGRWACEAQDSAPISIWNSSSTH